MHTGIHDLSGIRTYDPSVPAGVDCSCLRPPGHCDRQQNTHTITKIIRLTIFRETITVCSGNRVSYETAHDTSLHGLLSYWLQILKITIFNYLVTSKNYGRRASFYTNWQMRTTLNSSLVILIIRFTYTCSLCPNPYSAMWKSEIYWVNK
jgi:hypothetical protein